MNNTNDITTLLEIFLYWNSSIRVLLRHCIFFLSMSNSVAKVWRHFRLLFVYFLTQIEIITLLCVQRMMMKILSTLIRCCWCYMAWKGHEEKKKVHYLQNFVRNWCQIQYYFKRCVKWSANLNVCRKQYPKMKKIKYKSQIITRTF